MLIPGLGELPIRRCGIYKTDNGGLAHLLLHGFHFQHICRTEYLIPSQVPFNKSKYVTCLDIPKCWLWQMENFYDEKCIFFLQDWLFFFPFSWMEINSQKRPKLKTCKNPQVQMTFYSDCIEQDSLNHNFSIAGQFTRMMHWHKHYF